MVDIPTPAPEVASTDLDYRAVASKYGIPLKSLLSGAYFNTPEWQKTLPDHAVKEVLLSLNPKNQELRGKLFDDSMAALGKPIATKHDYITGKTTYQTPAQVTEARNNFIGNPIPMEPNKAGGVGLYEMVSGGRGSDLLRDPNYAMWQSPAYAAAKVGRLFDESKAPSDKVLGAVAGIVGTALGGPVLGGALGGSVGGASNYQGDSTLGFLAPAIKGGAKGAATGYLASQLPVINTGNPLGTAVATGAERGAASSLLNKGDVKTGALSGALSGGISTMLGTDVPKFIKPTITSTLTSSLMPKTQAPAPAPTPTTKPLPTPSTDKLRAYLANQKTASPMSKPMGSEAQKALNIGSFTGKTGGIPPALQTYLNASSTSAVPKKLATDWQNYWKTSKPGESIKWGGGTLQRMDDGTAWYNAPDAMNGGMRVTSQDTAENLAMYNPGIAKQWQQQYGYVAPSSGMSRSSLGQDSTPAPAVHGGSMEANQAYYASHPEEMKGWAHPEYMPGYKPQLTQDINKPEIPEKPHDYGQYFGRMPSTP